MFSHYKQEVSKYGKKDAIIALCFTFYAYVVLFAEIIIQNLPNFPFGGFAGHWLFYPLIPVPLFIILFKRKQNIASIGLHTKNLRPALLLGLVFCAIIILVQVIIPGFTRGWNFHSFDNMLRIFVIAISVSFLEDTWFSGYLQTRMYGLVKSNIAAVLIVSFLFALSHIPASLAMQGVSGFTALVSLSMVVWVGFHIIWNLAFRQYFSLFPVMMIHITWNFANTGLIEGGGLGYDALTVPGLLLIMTAYLLIVRHRIRNKSTEQANIAETDTSS